MSPLVSNYNAENLLAILNTLARRPQVRPRSRKRSLFRATAGVPGPFGTHPQSPISMSFVDYAHTPDALAINVLQLRCVGAGFKRRIVTVFSCGGSRNRALSMPLMPWAAVARLSDVAVPTSNNLYEAQAIAYRRHASLSGAEVLPIRICQAIEKGLELLHPDALLIAILSRGHENTHLNQRHPFSMIAKPSGRILGYA